MKTLEEVIREKLATGYDPVSLKVSARGVNDKNIEVDMEGHRYSVAGNTVSLLKEGEESPQAEAPAGDDSGESQSIESAEAGATEGAAEAGSDGNNSGEVGHEEVSDTGSDAAEAKSAEGDFVDENENNIDDELEARFAEILSYYDDVEGHDELNIKPSDTAENGATIFVVLSGKEEIARGTLLQLEEQIRQGAAA